MKEMAEDVSPFLFNPQDEKKILLFPEYIESVEFKAIESTFSFKTLASILNTDTLSTPAPKIKISTHFHFELNLLNFHHPHPFVSRHSINFHKRYIIFFNAILQASAEGFHSYFYKSVQKKTLTKNRFILYLNPCLPSNTLRSFNRLFPGIKNSSLWMDRGCTA